MGTRALKTTFLDNIAIFQGVSDQGRWVLHVAAEERIYHRGEFIIREGEFGDRMYVISEGSVQVVKNAGTAQELVLTRLTKGTVFGEMCVVEGIVRSASVRAAEPCLVYSVTNGILNKFGRFWPDDHCTFLLNLTKELSHRLRVMDEAFAARAF